jgi:hypothetical protein
LQATRLPLHLGSGRFKNEEPGASMKFMMLMIPAVYHGNKKLDPNFTPDPKMVEKMTKYNEELGKVFKITDLNGLHPLTTGARVSFTKGKTTVTDGPFIEAKEVLGAHSSFKAGALPRPYPRRRRAAKVLV